eukprot:759333-Hanusia_phi.AAC.5
MGTTLALARHSYQKLGDAYNNYTAWVRGREEENVIGRTHFTFLFRAWKCPSIGMEPFIRTWGLLTSMKGTR